MPVAMRIVQAGAAPPVESVGLGALLHEHSREAEMALRASHVQRAPPVVVTEVDRDARLQQLPHPRDIVLRYGEEKLTPTQVLLL
mmetsp:Transcript_27651/g.84291  ORF Transcript_27651/g.84291 Transcript_27651/m.84291 type:complete len:85 (+) Transcript_27651:2291-2545(+)